MISIIVPCYNSEDTIGECAKSILNQTYGNIELILVDDGSTDGTGVICDRIKTKDGDRVRVVHQPNRGRSAARAVGVRIADGEWCFFVDSDDRIPADAIQRLATRADDTTDIVFGNASSLPDYDGRETIDIDAFRHLAVRAEGTIGVPWGSLYRKSKLTDYLFDLPKEVYMGEDYIFWLRLVFSTLKPVAAIADNTYEKGSDTTSASFVWTVDYAQTIQDYRLEAIPEEQRLEYLADTVADRKANLFSCTLFQPRNKWKNSRFYQELIADMKTIGTHFTPKERLFLSIPSVRLRFFLFKTLNVQRST